MKRPPVGSDPELSGMQAFADGDHFNCLRENGKTIQVQATSLNDLLLSHNAPTNIDYLSIDTEGSELDLLLSFDFERYRIRIQQPRVAHSELTEKQGIFAGISSVLAVGWMVCLKRT
jgi:hypothetical protein